MSKSKDAAPPAEETTADKKLDFFKDLCADENLEVDGTFVYLPRFKCKVKVARSGSKRFLKGIERAMQPYKRYFRNNKTIDLPQEVEDKVKAANLRVWAETVLLGWEGINVDGKDFPYTTDNAVRLLQNKDFFADISFLANEAETFKRENAEDAEKN